MAKLEGVKVIDMNNGEVTKVTYNGEEYTKVDGVAKKGDLLLYEENQTYITSGYYEVVRLDTSDDAQIIDEDGDEYDTFDDDFEVFRKVNESASDKPTAESLNVGELAKVIKEKDDLLFHNYDLNDIVKVINIGGEEVFNCVRLSDSLNQWLYAQYLQRYTPQAGDKLTIDGVEYTLEERMAEAGEKVIVVNSVEDEYSNGEVHVIGRDEDGDSAINGVYVSCEEYLVLSPTVTVSESESITPEPTPITFVIKTKTGDIHEVLADDSDIVTVSAFAEEYLLQDETTSLVFIDHPDVFVPYENINSITVKGA